MTFLITINYISKRIIKLSTNFENLKCHFNKIIKLSFSFTIVTLQQFIQLSLTYNLN